jgi:SpoVK/Ycf46/Vps4 family AAA+-type ATPase
MATATQIKELLKTHGEGNEERFYAIAMQVAAAESKKGHVRLAEEIRTLVDRAKLKRASRATGQIFHVAQPQGEAAELLEEIRDNRRFSDLVLDNTLGSRITRILEEQKNTSRIKASGLRPRQRLLFLGPPGCGKTFTASAFANELGVPLFVIRLDALITRYLGESLTKLRVIFDAINRTKAIYLFDEFDSIGFTREFTGDVGEMRRVLNGFLMQIEKLKSESLVIAATNFGERLDKALYRRFDDLVEFGLPGESEAWRTIEKLLAGIPTVDLSEEKLVAASSGLSYSEITRACEEAIKDKIISGVKYITSSMLLNALAERRLFIRQ